MTACEPELSYEGLAALVRGIGGPGGDVGDGGGQSARKGSGLPTVNAGPVRTAWTPLAPVNRSPRSGRRDMMYGPNVNAAARSYWPKRHQAVSGAPAITALRHRCHP